MKVWRIAVLDIKTKSKMSTLEKADTSVIIIDCGTHHILEKSLVDWVKDSVSDKNITVVRYDKSVSEKENILNNINSKSKYTLVLYSFNPLLTKENVDLILDYLILREEKYIQLPYGCAFLTQYYINNSIKDPITFNGDGSQFLKVESPEELDYATEVIRKRIIVNFARKGVKFINPDTIVINAYVNIEDGVTIYPFNTLSKDTYIHKNVIIKDGNNITSSVIGVDSVIANSTITNTNIGSNCIVFPYNVIENTLIEDNCTIKSHNTINKAKIGKNTTIESFNSIF